MNSVEGILKLNNGKVMPVIGLGTFQIKKPKDVENALDVAFQCGYRLIDTASVYKNENLIGDYLPNLLTKYNLNRKDIFITTKLSPNDLTQDKVHEALDASLQKLKLDYIDLYLVHWPGKQGIHGANEMNKVHRKAVWLALEEIYLTGEKVRSIGVSNYTLKHLEEMIDYYSVLPAILQSEFHPDYQNISVANFCEKYDIHYQAYSSLGQSRLVMDQRFLSVARKYNKSISQILLRWSLQSGHSVIPKSKESNHILENINVFDFEISDEDIKVISDMNKHVKYAWNPDHVV